MEKNIVLSNGVLMPRIGLGTWNLPKPDLKRILKDAYDLGYRKLDCAWSYGNEVEIGNAIKELGIPREEFFITTKLHIKDVSWGMYKYGLSIPKKTIRKAVDEACKRFHTDYIDMYILHWPWRNYLHMWEEIEKLNNEGRIRAIGGTSFMPWHIKNIIDNFEVKPALNQVEFHPYGADFRLVEFCQSLDIAFESFSSFGSGPNTGHVAGKIFNEPILRELSEKYNRTIGQLILRWILQQGISIIPRSTSKRHLAENIDIFNFDISREDMSIIQHLNLNQINWANPWDTVPSTERYKY